MLLKMTVALTTRIQELTTIPKRDAGEGPVPYVVMVTLIAVGAAAVASMIILFAKGRITGLSSVPTTP